MFKMESKKIECPFCGYKMPITFSKDAKCSGIFVKCKGKKCKKVFEIKINYKKQVKQSHYVPMTTQKREVSKLADGSIRIDTKINKKGAEQGLDELKRIADTKVPK